MGDLTYIQSRQEVSITGQDSVGDQVNYVSADVNGNMLVKDYSDGPVTPGTVASASALIGGQYNSTLPNLTTTQQSALQVDSNGRIILGTGTATIGSLNNISGVISLPTGASTSALQSAVQGSVSPGTAAISSLLTGGVYNSSVITLTNTQQASLQLDSSGNLKTVSTLSSYPPDTVQTSTLSALNAVTPTVMLNGISSITVTVSGTFVGTIVVNSTVNSLTRQLYVQPSTDQPVQQTITAPGTYRVLSVAAVNSAYCTMTAYTSGSASVNIDASTGVSLVEAYQLAASNLKATVNLNDGSGNAINSTTNALNTYLTNALPAGTNNIGSITNVTGTVSLPTGAATSALQTSGNTLLSTIAANTSAAATDFTATGTITAVNQTVSITGQGVYTVTASITGTWVGLLVFEGQTADNNWNLLPAAVLANTIPFVTTNTTGSNGVYIITGGGFLNIRVRTSSYTSGTVNVALDGSLSQQTIYSGQMGIWTVRNADGTGNLLTSSTSGAKQPLDVVLNAPVKATYSAAYPAFTPAATPNALLIIQGSATKTIKILKIRIDVTQTTAGINTFYLKKYSSGASGGTYTQPTKVPFNSTYAAATALVVTVQGTNTPGTLVGALDVIRINTPIAGSVESPSYLWDFETGTQSAPVVLVNNTEQVSVDFNGAALPTGFTISYYIKWTEE